MGKSQRVQNGHDPELHEEGAGGEPEVRERGN